MALRWLSDLVGTKLTSFRINRATVDSSALTASRNYTLPDVGGQIALTSDLGSPSYTQGTASIVFGSEKTMARTTVSASGVAASSVISVRPNEAGTASHSADEHLVEQYDIRVDKVVPGVGFDLVMLARGAGGLSGTWSFKWQF